MRILIAEDDGVTRRILETMLRKWGHEVVAAPDGRQAWEILQQPDAPAMVILDWMMPGMDGIEVCQRLRQLNRPLRPHVMLLTGMTEKKNLVKGISAGADDYVTKPFDPEELRIRIYAGERILGLQMETLAVLEALRKQASHDYLTGLPNRGATIDLLRKEFARAPRTGKPVAIVLADVDHFKEINDLYGHQAGDVVLSELARRMAMEMRSYEDIGRYGGEEFMAVLADCSIEGGCRMAERLRRAVSIRPYDVAGTQLPVTASFGVSSTSRLQSPTEELLVRMADVSLYRAKQTGRNRVEAIVDVKDMAMEPFVHDRDETRT